MRLAPDSKTYVPLAKREYSVLLAVLYEVSSSVLPRLLRTTGVK